MGRSLAKKQVVKLKARIAAGDIRVDSSRAKDDMEEEQILEEEQQNKENQECKASGLSRSGSTSKTILAKRLNLVSMPTDAQVLLWQQHHMGSEAGKAQFETTKLLKKQRGEECEAWAKAQIQQLQRTLKGKEAQLQRELRKAQQEVEKLRKRRGIFQDINSMGKLTRQQYKEELVKRLGRRVDTKIQTFSILLHAEMAEQIILTIIYSCWGAALTER